MRHLALLLCLSLSTAAWAEEARLAIAEFDNGSDDESAAPLGKGLQSMLTTDLSQVDGLTLVERARLQELLDELDLGRSGVLDPATAARVGKTLGATHVVAGSFTVVGDAMRLDARLVAVESGEVLLAEQVEGEKAAFFELEKALVKALLKSLGEELSPKERAAIARIHTADYGAFQSFSEGIAAYDAERYEDALALLEKATSSDSEFKLAHVTLEEMATVIAEAKKRAAAARIAESEARFAARTAEAAFDAQVVSFLFDIAGDDSRSTDERASALYLLAVGLGTGDQPNARFRELDHSSDEFAMRRAGEEAWQDVWTLTRDRVPERFPVFHDSLGTWFRSDQPMDATYDYLSRRVFLGTPHGRSLTECGRHLIGKEWGRQHDTLNPLYVDRIQQLDLARAWLLDVKPCGADTRWIGEGIELAKEYRWLGRVDDAVALLKLLTQETQDPRVLDQLSRELEVTARHLELWRHPELTPLQREGLLELRLGNGGASDLQRSPLDTLGEPGPHAWWRIAYLLRGWGDKPYEERVFIGDVPVWKLDSRSAEVQTGPRTAPDRASSIRYYGETVPFSAYGGPAKAPPPPRPAWFIVGGQQTRTPTLSFVVDRAVAEDFWPMRSGGPGPEELNRTDTPIWGVIFGVKDVAVPPTCDPVDKSKVTAVPMRGHALLHDGKTLSLVQFVEDVQTPEHCGSSKKVFSPWRVERTLDTARFDVPDGTTVKVSVSGSRVEVQGGRHRHGFDLDEAPTGFAGLVVHGAGYLEVSDLTWSPGGS